MNNNYSTFIHYRKDTTYSLILATDNRGGIGLKNDLPWKGLVDNSEDMAWFREQTKGKIIVMGYNTWVSIGSKPLPGRVNVIITNRHWDELHDNINAYSKVWHEDPKNHGKKFPTIIAAKSPKDAHAAIGAGIGDFHHGGEVMVIGGAQIYEAFMEWTSRIYLTTFDGEFEADTFVHLSLEDWDLKYRDARSVLKPKFEIFECTEYAATRPDSEVIQIEHVHKPAVVPGTVVPFKRKEKE